MRKDLLDSAESAACGAIASKVCSVPLYPSSFSAAAKLKGIDGCDAFELESQSSAITAAMGAELSGKRTFVPLSSLHSLRELNAVSYMRLPVVAISGADAGFGLRDSGWIIFLAESSQEVLDAVIQAYRTGEDQHVMLPSLVSIDCTGTREVVSLPGEKDMEGFLPNLKIEKLDVKRNRAFGVPAEDYGAFLLDRNNCMASALKSLGKTGEQWSKKFKRPGGPVESCYTEDADFIIVCAGFSSPTIKSAVSRLRSSGEKVGFARLRVLRPFPEDELRKALQNAKKVAVVDSSISAGKGGILFSETRHLHPSCVSFVALRKLEEKDVDRIFGAMKTETGDVVFL